MKGTSTIVIPGSLALLCLALNVPGFSVPNSAPKDVKTESRKGDDTYDFHYDIRYPGHLRSDTSYDKVTEETGDIKDYTRRVVEFWPKRGIDVTPLADIAGAPKRIWTPVIPDDTMTRTVVDNFPSKPFEAYLTGFRGVGDDALANVNDPDSFSCPAPVLLLPDGSKRVVLAKYLSPEDRRYVLDIYKKDLERISKTLLQEDYLVQEEVKKKNSATGEDELYKDHEFVRFDTKHISILVPGNPPETGKSWVRKDNHAQVMQTIQYLKNQFEAYWSYHEYSGALVRYWENEKLFKYTPTVMHGGGGGGGGYGGCKIGGPRPKIVFHEWGHGMQVGGLCGLGGNESAADALSIMGDPSDIKRAGQLLARPWKNFFHGSYRGGSGYEILADDPNWGYAITAVTSTLAAEEDYTPMHVYAHLGVERGLWKKGEGIKGMGDLMGQIGARFAEFDCFQEFQFRSHFGAPNRSYLVPVDTEKGIYRCPAGEAPEPFGVSISRIVPDTDAKAITIDFQGEYDPETYSDWRACIVAVGNDNRCRYSPLWNKGKMAMDVREGDKRYWLTVTATPKALLQGEKRGVAWIVYQGGFTYRYPYQVVLSNCTPGSAYASAKDNNNTLLAAPEWTEATVYGDLFDLPAKMGAEEKKAYCKQLESILRFATGKKREVEEEYAATDAEAFVHERWYYRWAICMSDAMIQRIKLLLENLDGGPHENGGGWVAASAYAAPTAYVGKNCYVLDGAQVLDNAVLIDSAVVRGKGAIIKDNAKLSGKAAIIGDIVVGGYGRIIHPIINQPSLLIAPADRVTLQLNGTPQDGLFKDGLVANYACLRPEAVLLEDLLKTRSSTAFFNGGHMTKNPLSYDGRLVGTPGFDTAEGTGAVIFDGNGQYGELAPDAIDFGEIVVVIRIKPEAATTKQAIFDFGSSPDDRLLLELAADGSPILSWQVKHEKTAEKIIGSTKLMFGRWLTLRMEIDGQNVKLYLNDALIGQKKSSFRPADVYAPQHGRRNFIARDRSDRNPSYFNGRLDFVRVYSQVPEKYDELPDMPLISPTKAMAGILEALEKEEAEKNPPKLGRDHFSIPLALKNGWLHNKYSWIDVLLEWRYLDDWKIDEKSTDEITAVRNKTYELESQFMLKRFELQKEYLKKHPERRPVSCGNRTETKQQTANNTRVENKQLHGFDHQLLKKKLEITEQVYTENSDSVKEINSLKKRLASRIQQLTRKTGPVAKVFEPVIQGNRAAIRALEKDGTERTDSEQKEITRLKNENQQLRQLRDTVLVRRDNDLAPPSGLLYLDKEISGLRKRIASKELILSSLCAQKLLGNDAYITLKMEADRLKVKTKSPEMQGGEECTEEIAGFADYLKQNAEIVELQKEALKAGLDWYQLCTKVMYDVVPPEYYFPNDMNYKARKFTLATTSRDIPYFKQFRSSTDDIDQLKEAIDWQRTWSETCEDWDTENELEKEYEKQNDRVKRWLKRVKPYRYGE